MATLLQPHSRIVLMQLEVSSLACYSKAMHSATCLRPPSLVVSSTPPPMAGALSSGLAQVHQS